MPGKRPMSTMAPTMIFNNENKLILITGSPGGSYIPAAILRVVTGVIDFELPIGDATMLPRIHKDWPYDGLDYEKNISSDIVAHHTITQNGYPIEHYSIIDFGRLIKCAFPSKSRDDAIDKK